MRRAEDKSRLVQYDVLRVITTLLVVVSHCHYHVFVTPYGGIDYTGLMGSSGASWEILWIITDFVNTFTMPIFMALGGALFFRSMANGRFQSLGGLAANKAKRLLIPFLVVATLYSFPLKLLTGYFSGSENVLLDLLVGQLLVQGNTHLWYLPAMFFEFLICYVLEVYVKIPKWIKLVVLAGAATFAWCFVTPIQMLTYVLRFAVWFYAGYCFEAIRPRFDWWVGWGRAVVCCLATGLFYLVVRLAFGDSGISLFLRVMGLKLLVPAVAGAALYALACGIARTKLVSGKLYRCLHRDSFGIYLYSDPVNYVVLYLGATLCGEFLFGSSVGVFVLFALRIGLTLTCSVLVSELLRRCKVKYMV